jgi:alanyl-tRNA synthetase
VIPENDPTSLFTTAGMQPLVPYLLGEPHPQGKRVVNVQRCIRTGDIEEIGDDTHCTFFEMLGNWSLGDYFKKESIKWSWEFLTSEEWLHIPKERLFFTVFAGDQDVKRDEESYSLWLDLGVDAEHISFQSKEHNWWGPVGATGPCGPDTEIFIDTGKEECSESCDPSCDCGKFVEIWNNVFMEYYKNEKGEFTPLSQKNVDTGMGLERVLVALNGGTVYDTDLFEEILKKIHELSDQKDVKPTDSKEFRIIADHIRTATFILGDPKGITPSNVDQGYVLRRLIRRAIRYSKLLNIEEGGIAQISQAVIEKYSSVYPELNENKDKIIQELNLEEQKFGKTIRQGLKEFEKVIKRLDEKTTVIDGASAFKLYDTYGFPIELTQELATEKGFTVDINQYQERFEEHRKKSQKGAEQKFKGGLADHTEETTRLHTATHLLHEALRRVLGDSVEQRGSNITSKRLRFDFSFGRKLLPEEISEVETIVNQAIKDDLAIVNQEMTLEEAKQQGAIGLFESKYGEIVKVYSIGDFSKEVCGGPHVKHTGELGTFKIKKEESSSSGVRRIKAVLQ